MVRILLALLLLIPNLSLGEHNPVAVELRAKIEKEFREAGYYNRTKFEEHMYQSELKKIETQKSLNSPLTEVSEQMFNEKEVYRIFNITKKILENKKLLEEKLKEAKKIFTLYAFGDEYELAECWENRNCKPITGVSSNLKLKLPDNHIFVEPPNVDIFINVQPSLDRYIID